MSAARLLGCCPGTAVESGDKQEVAQHDVEKGTPIMYCERSAQVKVPLCFQLGGELRATLEKAQELAGGAGTTARRIFSPTDLTSISEEGASEPPRNIFNNRNIHWP